ncbi:MAG: hypothetical protein FJ100_20270 [Deltaproteobacteria bacterium]|nr:hypothetical protein [Deltaproteobacteria bacterium]
MRIRGRTALICATLCAAAGCVATTGSGSGTGTGTGTGAAVAVSGGAAGSSCPKDDQIGCAPGATEKVRCKNGNWVSDGKCETPSSCVETKVDGVVTSTACEVPPTSRTSDAIACVKADACLIGVSMSECMNPAVTALIKPLAQITGTMPAKELMPFRVAQVKSCIAAAKSCAEVHNCAKGGTHACTATDTQACTGSVAQLCSGGVPFALDCAQIGMPCSLLPGSKPKAVCAAIGTCDAPETFTCSGAVAKACASTGTPVNAQITINCGLAGGTCDPTAKFDDDPDVCRFGSGAPCDSASFVESCSGSVVKDCSKGKVVEVDCGKLGMACKASPSSSGGSIAACTPTPACPLVYSLPSASKVVFCDGAAGLRSFDCALAGMKYAGGECAF